MIMMAVSLAVIPPCAGSSSQDGRLFNRESKKCDPHPPGSHSLTNTIDKFFGKQGDDDFEL